MRLPNDAGYVGQVNKEQRWLPHLATHLSLAVPRPLAMGHPGCGFRYPWSIYQWIDADPATTVVDELTFAEDMASFLVSLRNVPAGGGPLAGAHSANRGGPLALWDEQTRSTIARLGAAVDGHAALAVWEAALASRWNGPDVWVHGDFSGSNVLVRDGRLHAVIDFGCSAVGDPACDLVAAWTMFDGESRRRFVEVVDYDSGTWVRAKGWALWKAVISIDGKPPDHRDRSGIGFGRRRSAEAVVSEILANY